MQSAENGRRERMKTEIEHCRCFNPQTLQRTERCPRFKDNFGNYVDVVEKCVGSFKELPCKEYRK
jgi:hypothetical protein